jgi:MOSC domain-containing protein YiiM
LLISINTSRGGVPKLPRAHAAVTPQGVEGDRQRDLRHHGGPDRAVCLYSFDRIRELQREGHSVSVGLLGENLTLVDVDWRLMTPGTALQIGDVHLTLKAFAVPCRNLSAYFEGAQIGRVAQKLHPGWSRVYARVDRPGLVWIGDPVRIVDAGTTSSPLATEIAPQTARATVRRTGTLRVAAPLDQAFPFFTPDGERLWVPDFDPEYLHPLSGDQGVGAIFTTSHGGENTLWMVLRFSPREGVAEYARVTPGSRRGTVHVRLEALDANTTGATVSYDLASTSASGDAVLEALTPVAYADMLADWERRIAQALRGESFD